jgi:hypothetical protein
VFFYKDVLGVKLENVQSLRARRPKQLRRAPDREETLLLLKTVQADADFATALAVRLLYGCGLRVCEPLNLRVRDVDLKSSQLVIRAAKGGKDRVVAIPCSVLDEMRQQIESARAINKLDQMAKVPITLPHQLATKYPRAQFDWNWAWVFPAAQTCLHPRTGKLVRWRSSSSSEPPHPPRSARLGVVAPRCSSFTGGRYAAALARAMALPLTFTASSEAGLSRSRVKRRLNRYRRSSDALRRRRFAYSALHCARRRVCPPRLMPAHPAPTGSTPIGQVSANTLGQRHVARTAKL